jgi:hypothetical protein
MGPVGITDPRKIDGWWKQLQKEGVGRYILMRILNEGCDSNEPLYSEAMLKTCCLVWISKKGPADHSGGCRQGHRRIAGPIAGPSVNH